jgi:hypothetical protein
MKISSSKLQNRCVRLNKQKQQKIWGFWDGQEGLLAPNEEKQDEAGRRSNPPGA